MITLSSTQSNNTIASTPIFQDWGPSTDYDLYYNVNAPIFVLPFITFLIKDVVNVPEFSQYSEFRLKAWQTYNSSSYPAWMNPISYSGAGYPIVFGNSIPITTNGVNFELTPVLQNIGLLPLGAYTFTHHFEIEGKIGTTWTNVSTFSHNYNLNLVNTTVIFNPKFGTFIYAFLSGIMPFKTINMSGTNWKIKINADRFAFSADNIGLTLTTVTELGIDYTVASGTGTNAVKIEITDYYDQAIIFTGLDLAEQFYIYEDVQLIGHYNYNVIVTNQDIFERIPDELNFVAQKGLQEPVIKQILFSCLTSYTITASPWLIITEEAAGPSEGFSNAINVVPIPTLNMSSGIYVGFVTITATIDSVVVDLTTVINYDLQGLIASPYSDTAFTLDPLEFSFASNNIGTYFQVNAEIKTNQFFSNIQKITSIPQKLVLFQGNGTLDFGRLIHRLMDKFTQPNEAYYQYKPATLKLVCEEKDLLDNAVIRSVTTSEIPFIAGLSRGIFERFGFLDFNQKMERVTSNSWTILNMLIPAGTYQLDCYRNGTLVNSSALLNSDGFIVAKKVFFNEFTPGDVIEYKIINSLIDDDNVPSKKFALYPVQKYSNMLVWENEFLLQSDLECLGSYSAKSDFDTKSQKLYTNWVEILEILETNKEVKFSISTGWILKTDIDKIESLMRSKRVWIIAMGQNISLRPISKNMINIDVERGLIDYGIEFTINRKYNEETYSF